MIFTICSFPIITGKNKVNTKQPIEDDISGRLGYASTVAKASKKFLNDDRFADFTLAVPIGNIIFLFFL